MMFVAHLAFRSGAAFRPTRKAGAGPAFRHCLNFGRGERIRTSDFYLPKVALYQAELHPDSDARRLCGIARWTRCDSEPRMIMATRSACNLSAWDQGYSTGITVIFTRMRSPGSNGNRAM